VRPGRLAESRNANRRRSCIGSKGTSLRLDDGSRMSREAHVRRNGRTTISTSCWTCSAATSWAGGGAARDFRARGAAHRHELRMTRHRTRPAHDPLGSRLVDDVEARRAAPGPSRGDQNALAPTPGRMTIPVSKRSSSRSSTGPTSPTASARSSTPACTASISFPGPTPSTGIRGSACTRRTTCTSSVIPPCPPRCRPRRGSISQNLVAPQGVAQ
jgi:hypothetical protein